MQNYSEKNCKILNTFEFEVCKYPDSVFLIAFKINGKQGIFWSFSSELELPDYPFGKFKSSSIKKYKEEVCDIISDNFFGY